VPISPLPVLALASHDDEESTRGWISPWGVPVVVHGDCPLWPVTRAHWPLSRLHMYIYIYMCVHTYVHR
jgi:hypothetical protein